MLNISYAISPKLKEYLDKIESLRKQILLTPITPIAELKLRWQAIFNRTYYSLKLSGNPMTQNEMLKVLTEIPHKKMNSDQQEIIRYKKAQDYIFQNWLGSSRTINAQDILNLYRLIGNNKLKNRKTQDIQRLLDYLQARLDSARQARPELAERTKSENPIIKAAIVNIQLEKMQIFSERVLQISNLASLLFLYKYGYDFRGFLAYEKEWTEENRKQALIGASLTLWLEYFAGSILKHLEIVIQSIEKPRSQALELRESFWKLNERQKSILSFLDHPQLTITNRQIQKHYKTSQITASRDLAKMTNLGLLFSHGKGRSVYYTRV